MKINFTYNQIHQLCEDLAEKISALPVSERPTSIVGITRGGAIPAVILSHLLNIPCRMIDYSSIEGKGDDKNHDNILPLFLFSTPLQLIVDDICDSGYTMSEILDEIRDTLGNAFMLPLTATLIFKDHEGSKHTPDFYGVRYTHNDWCVFPWER